MGFTQASWRSNQYNRSLQTSCGSKFSKGKFDYSGIRKDLDFNTDFDKKYSNEQLNKLQKEVRTELKKQRLKTNLLTLVFAPLFFGILYYFIRMFLLTLG